LIAPDDLPCMQALTTARVMDQYFPIAHTCFFSIELPRYSSKDICYAKLLWAVNNCVSIDADNTREGRANMAGLEGSS